MAGKTRDELRASIFSAANSAPKSEVVEFFSNNIEIRQPSVEAILDMRDATQRDMNDESGTRPNRTAAMINMIVLYAYVPGTNEHVFEEADLDQMKGMPFGEDFTRVQTAISRLTNVDLNAKAATKN